MLLLALVAAITGTSWWTVRALERPKSILQRKLADAQRVLYYCMSHDRGPSFRLSGAETTLRIISHVMLPPEQPYDPSRRIRYGIRLTITDRGKELWTHEIYTQSRQSKDELDDGVWRRENSFIRDDSIQITDDRIFVVNLPLDIPPDAVLKVLLVGDDSLEGLIRIYNQESRGPLERQVAARSLTADKQHTEVWSNTYDPWSMLPLQEQLSRVRYRTERLSAIGDHGVDYETQVVYYTGFRLPLDVLEVEEAIKIHRHRVAALNLVGPTELTVRAEQLGSQPAEPGDQPAKLVLDAVSASAEQSVRPRQILVGESTSVPIPRGLHSVRLSTTSTQSLGVWINGHKNALFGAPVDVDDDDIGRLYPDQIRIPVLLSGPETELLPAEVAGLGAANPLDRVLRIEVRFIDTTDAAWATDKYKGNTDEHTPEDEDPSFAGDLMVTFYDANRTVVRTTRRSLRSNRAPFEWLDRTATEPVELSEPVDVRLIMPEGIASVAIRTSSPAVLRLFRYLPGEYLYELPYRDAELHDDVKWRYARIEKRIWWPMRPINHEQLSDQEQLATLVAQARLERHGTYVSQLIDELDELDERGGHDEHGGDKESIAGHKRKRRPLPTDVIEPLGDPERHMIIEPLDPERATRASNEWGAGMVAELPQNRDRTFQWPAGTDAWSRKRARIHYWADSADLGQTVAIQIDGKLVREETLWATHGAWEMPPLAPGPHQVTIVAKAASLRTFVDRPPVTWARLYRLRTVFAMDREPLRLRVFKRAQRRTVLYAVIYAPWKVARDDIQVRSVVSGGRPQRVEGELVSYITKADHQEPLPAARHDQPARFTDRKSGSAGYPRVITVSLGEDLVAGTHFVEIYSVSGRKLWVRFYVTNPGKTPAEEGALQWNFRDMP